VAENKKKGNVHAGHRGRLRKRFLAEGAVSFEDHQLIELLLFYSVPRADTNALAHRLLNEFGGMQALLSASPAEIQKRGGVGPTTAALLSLFLPLKRRMEMDAYTPRVVLGETAIAGEYAVRLFDTRQNGTKVFLICLDGANRLIGTDALPGASFETLFAHPAQIAETALRRKCARAILVCALTRGTKCTEESALELASEAAAALARLGMRLTDMVYVRGQRYLSCAERGVSLLGYALDA